VAKPEVVKPVVKTAKLSEISFLPVEEDDEIELPPVETSREQVVVETSKEQVIVEGGQSPPVAREVSYVERRNVPLDGSMILELFVANGGGIEAFGTSAAPTEDHDARTAPSELFASSETDSYGASEDEMPELEPGEVPGAVSDANVCASTQAKPVRGATVSSDDGFVKTTQASDSSDFVLAGSGSEMQMVSVPRGNGIDPAVEDFESEVSDHD